MAEESLKSRILNADDIPIEIIEVPEWGDVKLEVRGMNGKERAGFLRRTTADGGEVSFEKFYPELIIATVFDPESGEKVFGPADRDNINTKSGAALERVAAVAQRHSGLGASDVDDAVGKSEGPEKNAST
jgi:hypothetical protein